MRVPSPSGLLTVSRPPSAATRSCRPRIPVPRRLVGPADAVVGDLDAQRVRVAGGGDAGRGRRGVLGDVRQGLRHHEVGGGLDDQRQPAIREGPDRGGDRRALRERGDRRAQPRLGEDRRVDAAGELAQLPDRDLDLRRGLVRRRDRRRGSAPSPSPPSRARSRRSASDSETRRCWAPSWRSRSSRRRSASAASRILARDRLSSASAVRWVVKSRTIAVTSSAPLGAIRASNWRVPPGRSREKSNACRSPVSSAAAVAASAEAPASRNRRSWKAWPDRPVADAGTSTSVPARLDVPALVGEADHPVREGLDQRALAALALAVEADQERDRDRRRREVPGRDQDGADVVRDVGDAADDVDEQRHHEHQARDQHGQQVAPRTRGRDDPATEDHDRRPSSPAPGRRRVPSSCRRSAAGSWSRGCSGPSRRRRGSRPRPGRCATPAARSDRRAPGRRAAR